MDSRNVSGDVCRRNFLASLLQSPLFLAAGAGTVGWVGCGSSTPAKMINVFDFMAPARQKLSKAHWEFLMTGVEGNLTRQANTDGYRLFQIRPRRFENTTQIDTSIELFGRRYPFPIFLAPAGSQRAFHKEGELTVARAARARGTEMILSGVASSHVRDVAQAKGQGVWFQLYQTNDWSIGQQVIRRAEDAGSPVLVLVVDQCGSAKRESLLRAGQANRNSGSCRCCHEQGVPGFVKTHPMYQGLNVSLIKKFDGPVTWDLVDRIRAATKMKIVAKGIMTAEDASLCAERGLDGIIVSNHGGREETLMSTIEALPEIVDAVKGRIPVLIDGGIRRGTDVFKALAIGAKAVCIGRPYLWGLSAFGQPGVERVLDILKDELVGMMGQAGTLAINKITPAFIRRAALPIPETHER
jgi:4-hydroxymandelate oxidase